MDSLEQFFKIMHNDSIPEISSHAPELALDLRGIILSTNPQNLDLYKSTKSFQAICKQCGLDSPDLESIKQLQKGLLESLDSKDCQALRECIFRLNTAEILGNTEARNLLQCLNSLASKTRRDSKARLEGEIDLQTLSAELDSLCKKILELNLGNSLSADINALLERAKNQTFSLGITGVLSAGKSTFLNALLGKEILGTSTVPETATLTVLRHSEKEYARVKFWNLNEWEELKQQALVDESLGDFVRQSEGVFGERLASYITKEGLVEEINLENLKSFTSANHESKLCNLVRQIDLFTNLRFLEKGVEIVDTPGLDDPVSKREEITKTYTNNCDLLIHVMNASCVATQVDIEFILSCLVERNISRLLVVLTRADLISKEELEASLEYTKTSLSSQLASMDAADLLDRIDFIPVASFLALLHKTGRGEEAKATGYDLEKTGLPAIEAYLEKVLLGENSLKQRDLLYAAYRGLLKLAKSAQEGLSIESKILLASNEELEGVIDSLKDENKRLLDLLEAQTKQLDKKGEELEGFLQKSSLLIEKRLEREREKLKDKIYQDSLYGYENGKPLNREGIKQGLALALKDCFTDTSRDYGHGLSKKISQLLSDLDSMEKSQSSPPSQSLQANNKHIQQSLSILESKIPDLINKHSLGSKSELALELEAPFKEAFDIFYRVVCKRGEEVGIAFRDYFRTRSEEIKDFTKQQIGAKEEILNQTLQKRAQATSPEAKQAIAKRQKSLEAIIGQLAYTTKVLG